MSYKKYPLINKKGELIGTCEIDNVYKGDLHSTDLIVMCEDLNGNSYEVSAWLVERIINFSDTSKPNEYVRSL